MKERLWKVVTVLCFTAIIGIVVFLFVTDESRTRHSLVSQTETEIAFAIEHKMCYAPIVLHDRLNQKMLHIVIEAAEKRGWKMTSAAGNIVTVTSTSSECTPRN